MPTNCSESKRDKHTSKQTHKTSGNLAGNMRIGKHAKEWTYRGNEPTLHTSMHNSSNMCVQRMSRTGKSEAADRTNWLDAEAPERPNSGEKATKYRGGQAPG